MKIHERFLFKTLKNCLIHVKSFQDTLLKICDLTLTFSDIWSKGISCFISSFLPIVIELENNIDVYFEFTFRILSSILNKNQSTHFQPLIATLL